MPRARQRAIAGVASALAGGLRLEPGVDLAATRAELLALPGIGPWTAEYVAMRALADPDAWLPTDVGVRHALERLGAPAGGGRALAAVPLARRDPPLGEPVGSVAMDTDALLDWYGRVRRPLPWRRTRDPYALLVSEVMLQQTQAARVVPYFEAFLERFPDAQALAAAAPRDVLAAWSGLGYNRRALALQAAAKAVAAGGWPDDLTDLPGVGAYTAAAVGSFAWDRQAAAVDTNVRRVIERFDGVQRRPVPLARRATRSCPPAARPTSTRR